MSARMLWLLLAVHQVTGGRSQAQHHQVYSNVFFSHQPHTGRPSTSFVMVRLSYHLLQFSGSSQPSGLSCSRSSLRMVDLTSCLTVVGALCSPTSPERSTRCPATQSASACPSAPRWPPSPARCASTRLPPAGVRASLTWTVLATVSAVSTAAWPPASGRPRPSRRRGPGWGPAPSVHLWRTNCRASAVTPRQTAGAEVSRECDDCDQPSCPRRG